MRQAYMVMALALFAGEAYAQDEAALRRFFEGRNVTLKIDMPAASSGVEVRPDAETPVDVPKLGESLKDNGTAIHKGESAMISKVHVKGDHIEFQLGGGGYGTFGDAMASSGNPTSYEGKSTRQKDLEKELKSTSDPAERKEIQEEIDQLERERQRANAQTDAAHAQTAQAQETNERAKRAGGGSRFNITYQDGIPADGLTPDGVMKALDRYVDFSGEDLGKGKPAVAAAAAAGGVAGLRKGLTVAGVEKLLGPATSASEEKDGSMDVNKRTYRADGQVVETKFVSGVLIDYSVKPGP